MIDSSLKSDLGLIDGIRFSVLGISVFVVIFWFSYREECLASVQFDFKLSWFIFTVILHFYPFLVNVEGFI